MTWVNDAQFWGDNVPAAMTAVASRHAFCVGVIGWLGSSLLPAANAGILPLPGSSTVPVDIAPALAWPVLS